MHLNLNEMPAKRSDHHVLQITLALGRGLRAKSINLSYVHVSDIIPGLTGNVYLSYVDILILHYKLDVCHQICKLIFWGI